MKENKKLKRMKNVTMKNENEKMGKVNTGKSMISKIGKRLWLENINSKRNEKWKKYENEKKQNLKEWKGEKPEEWIGRKTKSEWNDIFERLGT